MRLRNQPPLLPVLLVVLGAGVLAGAGVDELPDEPPDSLPPPAAGAAGVPAEDDGVVELDPPRLSVL